jgi:hypothetical protein
MHMTADTSRPPLAIVYNHRYDANIPVLDRLYGDRFGSLTHLVPFYDGDRPNVLRTTHGAYSFHAFIARYLRSVSHLETPPFYVFCADDLILNPRLDAGNLAERLGLAAGAAYIKQMDSLSHYTFQWIHHLPTLKAFHNQRNLEWERLLPPLEEARSRLQAHGVDARPLGLWNLAPGKAVRRRNAGLFLESLLFLASRSNRVYPYPLAVSYSDFVVVPGRAAHEFARLCEVFAAMGVFVEVAIPTALALSCEHVRTQAQAGVATREIWRPADAAALQAEFGGNLDALQASMPDELLYIHPVKLSKWRLNAGSSVGGRPRT